MESQPEQPHVPQIDWASIWEIASATQAMEKYIDQARETYPEAKRRFLEGLSEGSSFDVTVRLHDPAGHEEALMVKVDKIQGATISGHARSDSTRVGGFRYGQDHTWSEREIIDWMILHPLSGAEGNYLGKFWASAFTFASESEFEAMTPYIDRAHTTYPEAKRRFLQGLPDGSRFFVKVCLFDSEGHMELVSIAVDGVRDATVHGRIRSEMKFVRGYLRGQAYSVPERELIDWSIRSPDGGEGDYVGKFRASTVEFGSPWEAMARYIIELARETYPEAKRRFLEGLPEGSSFIVMVRLRNAAGREQDMGIAVDKIQGAAISGRCLYDSTLVRGYSKGQVCTCLDREVIDWGIKNSDGTEEGHYTSKYPLTDLVGE